MGSRQRLLEETLKVNAKIIGVTKIQATVYRESANRIGLDRLFPYCRKDQGQAVTF